jgi:hypothetical protein
LQFKWQVQGKFTPLLRRFSRVLLTGNELVHILLLPCYGVSAARAILQDKVEAKQDYVQTDT